MRGAGAGMNRTRVVIQEQEFDAGQVIRQLYENCTQVGAVASFVGVCRDVNNGDKVARMRLEHYPGMTEKSIEEIISAAREKWQFQDCVVIHRVGVLEPSDPIVLVAVSSRHRRQAFDTCAFVMDFLKTRAPFWKQEVTDQGERWVAARHSDEQALERWK